MGVHKHVNATTTTTDPPQYLSLTHILHIHTHRVHVFFKAHMYWTRQTERAIERQREGRREECISREERELSSELLNVDLKPTTSVAALSSSNHMKQECRCGNDSRSHTALIPLPFFTLDSFRTGDMMLKHTEEGFPLPVCASMETWCGVEGEERAHNSRGVEERLEEEEEED